MLQASNQPYPRPSKDPPDVILDAYPSPASDTTASDVGDGRRKAARSFDACLNCRARKKKRSSKKGLIDQPCSKHQVLFDIHNRPACHICFSLGIGCFGSFGEQRPKWLRDKQNMKLFQKCITEFLNKRGGRRGVAGLPHKPASLGETDYLSVEDITQYILDRNPPSPSSDPWWREYVHWYSPPDQQAATTTTPSVSSNYITAPSALSPPSTLTFADPPTALPIAPVALLDFTLPQDPHPAGVFELPDLTDIDPSRTVDEVMQFLAGLGFTVPTQETLSAPSANDTTLAFDSWEDFLQLDPAEAFDRARESDGNQCSL